MKKSKKITIGVALLALSISACQHHKKSDKQDLQDWQSSNGNTAYVSTDGGDNYNQGSVGSNFWFWMYMMRSSNGGYYYAPSAVYYSHYNSFRSSGRNYSVSRPTMRASTFGKTSGITRGGFGTAHSSSAS